MLQPTHESFLETFLRNAYTFNRILDDPLAFAAQSEALAEPWCSRFLSLLCMARNEFGQAESLLASTPSDDEYARLLRLRALRAQNKFQEALPQLEAWRNSPPNKAEEKDLWAAAGLLLAYTYHDTGKQELAVVEYDRLLTISGPDLLVAKALMGKGFTLGKLQRPEDALKVYEEVERGFGERQELGILEQVTMALVYKGFTLGKLQRPEDALQAFKDVERRFGERQEPGILESVARALVNKGLVLEKLQWPEDALQAYEDVEHRFGERQEPGIQELVAAALVNKGVVLEKLQRLEDALKVFNDVERRFGERKEPGILELVARALVNKGAIFGELQRPEDALQVFEDVERRFGKRQEPGILEPVATALVNKSVALRKLQRLEDALQVFEDVERGFGERQEPGILEQVANALVSKGYTLGELQRPEDELQVYAEVERRFGERQEPGILELVARALVNKGVVLGELQRPEDALQVFEDVARRFGERQEPGILEPVVRALVSKGVVLFKLQRFEDALQVFEDVERGFGERQEPGILELVAWALVNKGGVLGELQRPEDALQDYAEVERGFGERQEPGILEPVAKALVYKGVVLGELQRPEDALKVYAEVEHRFGVRQEPGIVEQVGLSQVNKAHWLASIGKSEERRETLESVLVLKGLPNGRTKGLALWSLCGYYIGVNNDERLKELAELMQALDPWEQRQEFEDIKNAAQGYLLGVEERASLRTSPQKAQSEPERVVKSKQDYINELLLQMVDDIGEKKRTEYLDSMEDHEKKRNYFIEKNEEKWSSDRSFLLILREWNSYTPALPSYEEEDRGGGYFLFYKGRGVVIDPGYDFISHFERAGGRLEDIDDIVITHAHNDHIAQLEDILTLLHQYNTENFGKDKKADWKKINLYMNQGADRKFTGLINLRQVPCKTLVRPCKGAGACSLPLCEGLKLMPLPAHHNDVITSNSAVGLWFTLDFQDEEKKPYQRHLVFTADSGIYPTDEDGIFKCDNDNEALEALYIDAGLKIKPDLLVAHIGAIKKDEFNRDTIEKNREKGYYPMHLGMRGTARIIYALSPKAAVVSEFGSEMRDIRDDVVKAIARAISRTQVAYSIPEKDRCFVLPGDLTMIYDIEKTAFYCHNKKEFVVPTVGTHKAISAASYATREFDSKTKRYNALLERCSRDYCGKPVQRAYIMETPPQKKRELNRLAEDYFRALFNGEIELLKKAPKK
jgi:tetratricopeptide (TPR) repeat protein